MNFEEIKPFIRYTSRLKPSLATDEKTLKAYDNCIVYALSGEGKIIVDDNGFQYASGYSHEVFKFIVQGEKVSSTSIEDEVFNNIRYSKVSDNNLSE